MPSKLGRVRNFDSKNGIGFIIPVDGGKDVLFHRSILHGGARSHRPRQGDIVEYHDHETPTGRRALTISQFMIGVREIVRSLAQRELELRAASLTVPDADSALEFIIDADLLRQANLAISRLDKLMPKQGDVVE